MITSAKNEQVKNIIQLNQKAKTRREQGLFVAEGRKMFGEAPRSWISKVYVAESLAQDTELMAQVEALSHEVVSDSVFRQMSDTQTPQGILTVLKTPSYTIEDILKKEKSLIMVLEDLQDPGNAGTIFRTGEGAGIDGVFLTRTSVDVTNPKVIRSTMGSIYRIPFLYIEDVVSLKAELKKRQIRTFAAHLQGRNSYDKESYEGGTAFFIGNEGKGLTEEAAQAADCLIRIPMCGKVESLNAAMAAGILMYEAARQRRDFNI
jgi:TrmH family RNA methyltransferase